MTQDSIASATALAEDCMTADALATILLLCDNIDDAKKTIITLKQYFPGSDYCLLSRSGSFYSTF